MPRFILFLLILLVPTTCFAEKSKDPLKVFLQNRQIIAHIYFNPSSTKLTPAAKTALDLIAPELRKYKSENSLLRLEGFSNSDNSSEDTLTFSMKRALAARNYLKDNYNLTFDIYLTGFGGGPDLAEEPPGKIRRVDIVVYKRSGAADALFDDQDTVTKFMPK
ncbi:OmpA family protein [Geopsychrobacter electrodiphilus]|uniref:OmpA family protein n=1 Tax=Geopsychrobacter electrodiphilus TaxID=225196 RepID=UPI0003A7CD2E|nr:OmpA family protein [Geopsychrobacter electrodiphilus]